MPGVKKSQPMNTIRRQDDGAPDKMSPFKRINTEFGDWKPVTTTPATTPTNTMSSEEQEDDVNPNAAPSPAPPTTTTRPCKSFNPHIHGTPRYSKMDKFIEGLVAASESLPTPLVGSASAPPSRPTKDCSSAQHRHPQHRPLLPVKEVKFADEVVEIGKSEGVLEERFSERTALEVRLPAKEKVNSGGRVSRAMRFDYKKRRSDFVKAATVMQSTYRGSKICRGQPLKYLLVISSVNEKLEELRQQFDAWKIAAWFPTDLAERVAMTESVMDLLLQLDSLQGVPVVVREFRKNVARDVIKFQEEVDGFICRNSKHGVLFDLTRPEAKAAQGSGNPNPSKAIRNIAVHEINLIENVRDSNSKACRTGHNGSWREDVKGGTSTDVTSDFGSDSQNKNTEVPLYSVRPPGCSGQDFVLWSPVDAEFEKLRLGEKSSEEKEKLDSITELKKCVASVDKLDIYVPPDRKKKLGARFGIAHFGNKSSGKEHPATTDECPHAPLEDPSPCKSTCIESLMEDMPNISSLDVNGYYQEKEDSKFTVSINTERSLDTNANGRIHTPKGCRIAKVHKNMDEDRAIRHPQTRVQPDYSSREKWEAEFPAAHCDSLVDKGCIGVENTPALMFEPPPEKNKDTHAPAEILTSNDLYDDGFRHNKTKLFAFPSRVEYVSARDVIEGTIEPLLASDHQDNEMNYPITAAQLECSSKDTFRYFDDDYYIDSSHTGSKGNRVGTAQNRPDDLAKEGDPCNMVVFFEEGEQLQKLGIPGSEVIVVGQSALAKNCGNAPVLIPSRSILKDNIREQLDGEPGSEYEMCGFDDLETISSCSNCAACPVDCIGEPWDFESGIAEQMPHQPYALKGLVWEFDEVFSERKGKETRCFEAGGYWKDQAWRDFTTTEFQPYHDATGNSQPIFERELEVQREDGSCKSFRTFENDELQCFQEIEQKILVETKMASPHEQGFEKATCLESEPSKLACTSQSLGEDGVASESITSVPREGENNLLLTKLVEDNKRLKELLKEVMKWNTVQANAMITLNERLELVESKK